MGAVVGGRRAGVLALRGITRSSHRGSARWYSASHARSWTAWRKPCTCSGCARSRDEERGCPVSRRRPRRRSRTTDAAARPCPTLAERRCPRRSTAGRTGGRSRARRACRARRRRCRRRCLGRLPANPNQSPGAAARRCEPLRRGRSSTTARSTTRSCRRTGSRPSGSARSSGARCAGSTRTRPRERCRQGVGLILPDRRRGDHGSSSSGIKRKDNLERPMDEPRAEA